MISRLPSFKGSTKSAKTAWKRENLRVQLSSAPSIEECGLDSLLYGEGLHVLTPRESTVPPLSSFRKTANTASISSSSEQPFNRKLSMPGLANDAPRREAFVDEDDVLSFNRRKETIEAPGKHFQSINFVPNSSSVIPARQGELDRHVKRKAAATAARSGQPGNGMTGNTTSSNKSIAEDDILIIAGGDGDRDNAGASVIANSSRLKDSLRLRTSGLRHSSSNPAVHYSPLKASNNNNSNNDPITPRVSGGIELDEDGRPLTVQDQYRPVSKSRIGDEANVGEEECVEEEEEEQQVEEEEERGSVDSLARKSIDEVYSELKSKGSISEIEEVVEEESSSLPSVGGIGRGVAGRPKQSIAIPIHNRYGKDVSSSFSGASKNNNTTTTSTTTTTTSTEGGSVKEVSPTKSFSKPPLVPSPRISRSDSPSPVSPADSQGDLQAGGSASTEARKRWRRVSHTLTFARHMSSVRASASDFLEHTGHDRMSSDYHHVRSDAGRAGAAAFEGARTRALGGRARAKGRKGMEGMLVRQDKGLFTLVQDFYVACLKMPIAHFLVGVFLAPIALGLLFTPLYLCDKAGLAFDGVTLSDDVVIVGKMAAAKQKVSALLNVFLYALSLSTTFGGSPVNAMSPFCLVVANINTLMGQFLFVFLSGAVFARMSQPSHPVRCSKKAIIRTDDFTSAPLDELKEKFRVFAVRLVLTGPPPCELVDAKICLTFRIFIKLPSGSMFCSTQDLELVRPDVPYLRYGIMVRHIIDKRSPLYGHTMESLSDGDASFSLTISGQERTSMQPIFHLEDYFVCDGDVAWDGDYVDFIHINAEGQRVLDHSKIDEIHRSKETKFGYGGTPSTTPSSKSLEKDGATSPGSVKGWSANALRGRKIWSSKSTSFTRADW